MRYKLRIEEINRDYKIILVTKITDTINLTLIKKNEKEVK